jgi:primosomal protein N''
MTKKLTQQEIKELTSNEKFEKMRELDNEMLEEQDYERTN